MVVHVGVVLIAVAFAASHSFASTAQLPVKQGQTVHFDGHSFTFTGTRDVATSTHTAFEALIRVDHGRSYAPAISNYPFASEAIGTPSIRSTLSEDIYLTLAGPPTHPGGSVVIGVILEPLVSWIWIGGSVMLLGTVLAVWPGRRRSDRRGGTAGVVTAAASRSGQGQDAPPVGVGAAPIGGQDPTGRL